MNLEQHLFSKCLAIGLVILLLCASNHSHALLVQLTIVNLPLGKELVHVCRFEHPPLTQSFLCNHQTTISVYQMQSLGSVNRIS